MAPRQGRPVDLRSSIPFTDFRQVVRKHRPSALLPVLAAEACAMGEPPYDLQRLRARSPWAIAAAARESLLHGNEHRAEVVTNGDINRIYNAFNNIYEHHRSDIERSVHAILTRTAYEQFPYQESIFEEVSRTHALLVDGADKINAKVLTEHAWEDLLGAPLGQIVGATFFLSVAANENNGWYDPAWTERDDLDDIFDRWPRDVIRRRADQLSASVEEFKADYEANPQAPAGWERYGYNPLWTTPFIKMGDGRLLAPQPRLILRTVSPGALYYRGIKKWDKGFGSDFGRLTERYVGRHLKTIEGAEVHPEIVYKKGQNRSIDWFLIFPSVVVMLEVKSARFGLLDSSRPRRVRGQDRGNPRQGAPADRRHRRRDQRWKPQIQPYPNRPPPHRHHRHRRALLHGQLTTGPIHHRQRQHPHPDCFPARPRVPRHTPRRRDRTPTRRHRQRPRALHMAPRTRT